MSNTAAHDASFARAESDLRSFSNSRLFVTGGTGFVGTSILESIQWANRRLGSAISAVILTRDVDAFRSKQPELCVDPAFSFVSGDVVRMPAVIGAVDGVIHAATPASAAFNESEPQAMFDTIVSGGREALNFAIRCGSIPFLFLSSGAVYGPQPSDVAALVETYCGAPDPLAVGSAYGEGKRVGEFQCAVASVRGVRAKIARLFAFVGPHLPLDRHFAIGNFIADAIVGRPIAITGDGTTVRSYLDSTDMVAALWAIFARGEIIRPYNVGSSRALDLKQVAEIVAVRAPNPVSVTVGRTAAPGAPISRYVPDMTRIRSELGFEESVSLEEAVTRTIAARTR